MMMMDAYDAVADSMVVMVCAWQVMEFLRLMSLSFVARMMMMIIMIAMMAHEEPLELMPIMTTYLLTIEMLTMMVP
jgi:hypothetical protein